MRTDTIYINQKGEQVTTKEKNLSNIITKEIMQIGFYQNEKGEIQVVKMPRIIEKVPNKLPPEITSLQEMFSGTLIFNQDLSQWDTANVTNMQSMFSVAKSFNGNISSWNTANVTNMHNMFGIASAFNQDISQWDTSNVTNMRSMFSVAESFNQDISQWNTTNVTNMSYMFYEAKSFNQDISLWNVNKIKEHYDFSVDSGIHNPNKLPKKWVILGINESKIK